MPYLGASPTVGLVTKLSNIASSFNGVTTTFQLSIPPGGATNYFTPGSTYALFVRLGGVTQNPDVDYTVSGSQITFTTAPASGLTCFIIAIGQAINIGVPGDGSVGQSKLGTITSLPLTGATSGTTTLAPPAVAGNNTITLPASNGSANQLLKNSGTAGTLTYSTATEDSSGNFAFNSGYGSVATAYGCRAWVNFDGTANTNLSGTYSQSGTTVTVTATAHGYIVGSGIYADITSGTGVDGTYTVVTVTDANTFTYTAGTSLTTSGNVTLRRNTIRASGNVSSITDNGVGDYTVNFTTAIVDANYTVCGACNLNTTGNNSRLLSAPNLQAPTASAVRIGTTLSSAGTNEDQQYVYVAIFR